MFENLHRNKKLAYLDGFLCGITATIMAQRLYRDYREMKQLDSFRTENTKTAD